MALLRARQSGRNLVVLGGLALVVLGLTYLVMVQTDFGQTFGDSAYLGRLVESKSARETARGILNVITGATIATAFAIALLLVSSPRWRPMVGLAGALWVSLVCSATLAAGWHRPSDAVGGVALATGFMAISGGLLVSRRFVPAPVTRTAGVIWPGATIVFLLASASLLASITRFSTPNERPGFLWWAFPLASLAIDAVAICAVCFVAWLMRGVIDCSAAPSEPATVTSSHRHWAE